MGLRPGRVQLVMRIHGQEVITRVIDGVATWTGTERR